MRIIFVGDALDVVAGTPKLKEKDDVQDCPYEGYDRDKFHDVKNWLIRKIIKNI